MLHKINSLSAPGRTSPPGRPCGAGPRRACLGYTRGRVRRVFRWQCAVLAAGRAKMGFFGGLRGGCAANVRADAPAVGARVPPRAWRSAGRARTTQWRAVRENSARRTLTFSQCRGGIILNPCFLGECRVVGYSRYTGGVLWGHTRCHATLYTMYFAQKCWTCPRRHPAHTRATTCTPRHAANRRPTHTRGTLPHAPRTHPAPRPHCLPRHCHVLMLLPPQVYVFCHPQCYTVIGTQTTRHPHSPHITSPIPPYTAPPTRPPAPRH